MVAPTSPRSSSTAEALGIAADLREEKRSAAPDRSRLQPSYGLPPSLCATRSICSISRCSFSSLPISGPVGPTYRPT
jgi:hypothetical protein